MLHIKRYFDKISNLESKKTNEVVLSMVDARGLRDEIAKLLIDLNDIQDYKKEEIVQIQITGGKFK